MSAKNFYKREPSIFDRLVIFLEEIWPSIYRLINGFIDGIIGFIKDLFSSLLP